MSQSCQTWITLPCRLGLHMRAACRFFQFVRRFQSEIKIKKGKFAADAKSILGLLALGIAWKSKLSIEAKGHDAVEAVRAIEDYFRLPENCLDAQV